MEYAGDLARIQQAASRTEGYAARRAATFQATEPKLGEAILDVGCGSGLFVRSLAEAVGSKGRACEVDLSEEQLAAARETCTGLSNVELQTGDAIALPFSADSFDAVTSIHVIEYINDDLMSVAHTMTEKRIRHLPVMEQGKLVGIVSLGDLVRAQRDHYEGRVVTLETMLSD